MNRDHASRDMIIRDITPRRLQRSNTVRGRSASRRPLALLSGCVNVEPLSMDGVFDQLTRVILGQLSEIREPWRVLLNYTTGITLFYEVYTYSINKFRRPPVLLCI